MLENILHNARVIKNIPQKISITNRKVVVDGEIICNISNFAKFQKEYKNPRNFAAGSIRLLSAEECSKRNLEFIAWDLIEGYKSANFFLKLDFLKKIGFTVVPYIYCKNASEESPSNTIEKLDELRKQYSHYPIDGYVFKNSLSLINGKFIGLAIDYKNDKDWQARADRWIESIKSEF